jgi:hypothetical protein
MRLESTLGLLVMMIFLNELVSAAFILNVLGGFEETRDYRLTLERDADAISHVIDFRKTTEVVEYQKKPGKVLDLVVLKFNFVNKNENNFEGTYNFSHFIRDTDDKRKPNMSQFSSIVLPYFDVQFSASGTNADNNTLTVCFDIHDEAPEKYDQSKLWSLISKIRTRDKIKYPWII